MDENWTFQSDWEKIYFQVEEGDKTLCLLCPTVKYSAKSILLRVYLTTFKST